MVDGQRRSVYMVFKEVEVDGVAAWHPEGEWLAHNALAAIKEAVQSYDGQAAGTFAAVPRVNFHRHSVRVETVQQVTVE